MKSLLLPVALLSAKLHGSLAGGKDHYEKDDGHTDCGGCNGEADVETEIAPAATGNVVDVAFSMPETFSTLLSLTTRAEIVDDLKDPAFGSTVFAPTNDAWIALDAMSLPSCNTRTLSADPDWMGHLHNLLDYHIIDGSEKLSGDVADGSTIAMRNGEDCTFTSFDGVTVNTATVIAADVTANNGKCLLL